ncbi:HAMP domain-containing sensor histidine kinase [Zobellia roscoffensis]|uniref:sensor histidine kinase n=1 Tax=Zobellia roscoffensis TaxID=2779508 RepID=UPI00188ACD27|nr:HAMP domain-containing sensor histidine kinase [Zobellia roscoffensis]
MKLLNHTSKYFAILLIVLISVWAVIFYFAMLDEVYDSLDDGLENQMELIVKEAKKDSAILHTNDFGIGNFTITKTSLKHHHKLKDIYRDTLMYMQNEDDYEPVRILESVFEHKNSYYKIKLITSMVEEDDQIENLITYLIWLYIVLVTSVIILNNLVLKKVWSPFYSLVARLKEFRIEKDEPIQAVPTNIDEFELLNHSVEMLTKKSRETYVAQKEFIENAAHELQTPLAISINKLELLLERNQINDAQSQVVGAVLENLGRLTRLNKSLLLLSKIDNKQYIGLDTVNFQVLATEISDNFEDFAKHQNIELELTSSAHLEFAINTDLARVLLTNLIKNAIIHGERNNKVTIEIADRTIHISNMGSKVSLDASSIFDRFKKSGSDQKSTGLGLSISKAIADKYGIRLVYSFSDRHVFSLYFPAH